ncbi:RNA polymerase sigma-70 factor, ECF subfamily [Gramella sp. MAR_2010_147]|nr:RNA polymerase sigma-70 factor, ECF subfamily [Gramella sp. MAR_2010_147]
MRLFSYKQILHFSFYKPEAFNIFTRSNFPDLQNSEDILVSRLQDSTSSQEAFRELISEYKERLYWHIRNIVKNHDDTDDILQNTFLKVYKNINQFKGDSKLYTWMYRIATNESITFLNKKARRLSITSEELQNKIIDNLESDVYFDGNEIQLKLQKAIATLPEKQQQVFVMKYFEELKYREMSELLDTSEGALKASYHIAAKKIEEYLKSN